MLAGCNKSGIHIQRIFIFTIQEFYVRKEVFLPEQGESPPCTQRLLVSRHLF